MLYYSNFSVRMNVSLEFPFDVAHVIERCDDARKVKLSACNLH